METQTPSAIDQLEDAAEVGMTHDELQSVVKSEIERAVSYVDGSLAPDRELKTRYYRGDKFGNEEEGRSQVVSRDVRDAVQEIKPGLIEVFAGSERAVEYVPRNAEDVPRAEQATEYINYVVMQDNPGFSVISSALDNALYNDFGAIKWWWDDSTEVSYHEFTGLDDAGVGAILQEEGIEVVAINSMPDPQAALQLSSQGLPTDLAPMRHDLEIKRVKRSGRARIMALPPEELIFTANTRSETDTDLIGHRSLQTVSALVAMGYPIDLVESHTQSGDSLAINTERQARQEYTDWSDWGDTDNPSGRRVLYCEVYINADYDGDGIAELRKVCTMGDAYEVVRQEPVDEVPIAVGVVDPEPHTMVGHDIADQTMDIQKIKSMVSRGILDSLALTLDPRTEAVEGMVNMEDLLNPEVGGVVRVAQPGMLRDRTVDFVGTAGLAVIQWLDDMRDSRTGQHNMALSADALQSTTASAVSAQVEAALKRQKLIARTLAETMFKRLYGGLLRLVTKHQRQERMVRLRNEWVPVDPRVWDANMDVVVNVGLGGLTQERLATYREILAFQTQVLERLGPSNPMVTYGHVTNTMRKILELSDEKDPSQYMDLLPLDFRPPQPPPGPSPEELLAQIEGQKNAIDAEKVRMDALAKRIDQLLDAEELERKYPEQGPVELNELGGGQ